MLLIKLRIKVCILLPHDLPFMSALSVTAPCAGSVTSPAKEGTNRCRHHPKCHT